MAVVQNPLIHRASGSVGNSIFSKWKGKNTLRSKSIAPYPPPSLLQSVQRTKFKNCIEFFSTFRPYSQYLFSSSNNRLSSFNSIVKQNVSFFAPDANIIHVASIIRLIFSIGTIESWFDAKVQSVGFAQLAISGNYLLSYADDASDVKSIAFIVDSYSKALHVFESAYGSSLSVLCSFDPSLVSHEMFCFFCQVDRKLKKASTSKFINSIVLT